MDNFSQQFKNNLESQPLPDFDANDWKAMQQKLAAKPIPSTPIPTSTSGHKKIWWALAAISLLFLLSNVFLFKELQKATAKINLLSHEKDTIVVKETHYKIDTIYQIIHVHHQKESNSRNAKTLTKNHASNASLYFTQTPVSFFRNHSSFKIPSNLSQWKNSNNSHTVLGLANRYNLDNRIWSNRGMSIEEQELSKEWQNQNLQKSSTRYSGIAPNLNQWKNGNNSHTMLGFSTPSNLDNQTSDDRKMSIEEQELSKELQNKTLQKLPLRYPEIAPNFFPLLPVLEAQFAEIKQKKTLVQRLYPLRPKSLAVGGNLGKTYFFKANQTWDYGLNLNVAFSDNLKMWLGGQYLSMDFESYGFNEDLGIPMLEPPNDNFELEEIKVNRQGLHIDAGMQYFFNVRQKLKPFVGIGFGKTNLSKNEVEYKFENKQIDEEWEDYRQLGKISRDFMVFKAGLSYPLFPHWSSRLEGVYRHNINNSDNQVPNNIGVRLGVFYDFGKK